MAAGLPDVADSETSADPELQRELLLFDESVVEAASKHEQPVTSAPASVTIITGEEIRRFGYRTLAEVLRSAAGLYSAYDRNYSYIGVRGFLRPGDYNDRILLLVNGHTYNDDVYQTAYLGPEFGIDLEIIDRVEVVRGPGSVLYGGNALFAVVNVVTKTGANLRGTRPLLETGSFYRKRAQVASGHVFDNGFDVLVDGSVFDVDGPHKLFFPEFDSPETNNGFAIDADGERAFNVFLRARYRGFQLQGGVNRRQKTIPTGAFDSNFNDRGTQTIDGRQFADLSYTVAPNEDLLLLARAYYDGVYYHGTYVYGYDADRVENEDLAPSNWLGGELRLRWKTCEANALTVGGEYSYHPDATQKNYDRPTGVVYLDDHQAYDAFGIYLQDEIQVLPSLTLTAGVRFDRIYDHIEAFSPRIAAVWAARPTTHLKLIYGGAFRPPNLYELYYGSETGDLLQVANPTLGRERITTYEAVLEQGFRGGGNRPNGRAALSVYHWAIDDLIDQVEVGLEDFTLLQYRNVGGARATGVELEVRAPLPYGLNARGVYTFQHARLDGGRRLSDSPEHLGTLGLLLPEAYGVEAATELQIVGPRQTLLGESLDTAVLLNLNLIYATPIRNMDLTLGIYNLLDQTIFDPGGAGTPDKIEQDGITFRAQVVYAF